MARGVVLVLAILCLGACSTQASGMFGALAGRPGSTPAPTAAPPPPAQASGAIAPPADVTVAFSGLPAGLHPVHVHSRCSGNQAFHITTVGSLREVAGAGAIAVPRGYFGRGLCLIVYGDASLSTVVATRPI